MRVLLDENVDRRLRPLFDNAFEVITVIEHGWGGLTNGELLNAAQHEFDVLVTMDRNMPHQQNLSSYSLGIVLITARSNKRQDIEPAMPDVNRAVQEVNPGELRIVAA